MRWNLKRPARRHAMWMLLFSVLLAMPAWAVPSQASDDERKALEKLDAAVDGAIVYTRSNRIWKVVIGKWTPVDLGPGRYARWSPDGKRIAVADGSKLIVMNADGSERRTLAEDVFTKQAAPVDFQGDGQAILYANSKRVVHSVDLATGKTTSLNIELEGELCNSADGQRIVGRVGNNLFAIDRPTGDRRRFAGGCSPGVSPDGRLLMHNLGGHREMAILEWSGRGQRKIRMDPKTADRTWDNQHWSNHHDYLAAQGDDKRHESYVVHIPSNFVTRLTWTGGTSYPDVYIATDAAATRQPTVATTPDTAKPTKPDWPATRDGLLFLWANHNADNTVKHDGRDVTSDVRAFGRARPGRFGQMLIDRGGFESMNPSDHWHQAITRSGAMTLELTLSPAVARTDDAQPIAALTDGTGRHNLLVQQHGTALKLSVPTADKPVEATLVERLAPNAPVHLVLRLDNGKLTAWVDGRSVWSSGSLGTVRWSFDRLRFGGSTDGEDAAATWQGEVEGVALYDRALVDDVLTAHAKAMPAVQAERKPAPRWRVRARLVEITPIPKVDQLQEYSRGLVLAAWDVLSQSGGDGRDRLPRRVHVAHWAVMDRQVLDEVTALKPGLVRMLELESFEDHPQLDAERSFDVLEDLDAPRLLDVTP